MAKFGNQEYFRRYPEQSNDTRPENDKPDGLERGKIRRRTEDLLEARKLGVSVEELRGE